VPAVSARAGPVTGPRHGFAGLPRWWPLAALTLLAAALRLSTLDLQSFWYDEAFTSVHVLHPSLWATLRSVSHTENSPPLWYVLEWVDYRVFGSGEISLRLLSALAGIAAVPVAWGIGRELAGRAAAIACALLVAVNPLFFWYSQEARVYGLFALTAATAMLCFLRALDRPSGRRMAAFGLTGALALATHYFAIFLLAPMALWLLYEHRTRRACLPALAAIGAVGVALLPLISAQGGHGTQWIGRWALSSRLQAVPQYYLTGYSGSPLGHGVELLVALPLLAVAFLGLWRLTEPRRALAPGVLAERARSSRGALIAAVIAACAILTPILLAAAGADYLAPRNLLAVLTLSVDIDLSPRLQRGNWRDIARSLQAGGRLAAGTDLPAGTERAGPRVITTVELGAAPLEYYIPGLHNLSSGATVFVREIVETGYSPLRASAGEPPAPGFHLLRRENIDGLIVYRFLAGSARAVSEQTLRAHVITLAHPEVLVPRRSSGGALG
jgi:hypothetical protein